MALMGRLLAPGSSASPGALPRSGVCIALQGVACLWSPRQFREGPAHPLHQCCPCCLCRPHLCVLLPEECFPCWTSRPALSSPSPGAFPAKFPWSGISTSRAIHQSSALIP